MIGVDPAPGKGLSVFDGRDYLVPVGEARDFVQDVAASDDVLVCWDAPLTGPSERSVRREGVPTATDFTKRPIERFFSRADSGFKVPEGISIRSYTELSHWALTRHLLGLPRVGPWDRPFEDLPFGLVKERGQGQGGGRWVVEVHPGVAVWLWCKAEWSAESWRYKKDRELREALWNDFLTAVPAGLGELPAPSDDDQMDARVAYLLGVLWTERSEAVDLLGDLDRGALLVPQVPDLARAFKTFTSEER